ncbi:MAG: class I SAM-dependent methyltransferase [Candidatus Sericytochromatia bacterium]
MKETMATDTAIHFKDSSHEALYELEAGSFWFRARNRLLLWAMDTYAPASAERYLELGCGNGFVLSAIERHFPNWSLVGSEPLAAGLDRARTRVERAELLALDARHLPYESAFDVIGSFDVLEHIVEDEAVLAEIHKALKPGGVVFLTVPQHAFLWSPADDYAEHVRRYAAPDLHAKLARAGFTLRRSTSFVSVLLPMMLASRLVRRIRPADHDPEAELRISPVLDRAFELAMRFEQAWIRRGVSLPAGGSLLVVAEKA